jgi:predicted regulator of Ras-like GTPase activity (Roadblock/LC7/MglB family)|tara:strand:- start:30 stop:386 length:357 start_codon:yes stop_codon:yes gene_type:complete
MFKEKLTRVVNNVNGSIGCLLIGFDGIQIDSVYGERELPEMNAIAIEVSNLLDKFRRMKLHDIGEVNEVSITTGEVTALARVVADEYLLVLAMDSHADVNRGQTMLRLISPFVEQEMR